MVLRVGTGARFLRFAHRSPLPQAIGWLPVGRREAIGSEHIAGRQAKGCGRGLDGDGSLRAGEGGM